MRLLDVVDEIREKAVKKIDMLRAAGKVCTYIYLSKKIGISDVTLGSFLRGKQEITLTVLLKIERWANKR